MNKPFAHGDCVTVVDSPDPVSMPNGQTRFIDVCVYDPTKRFHPGHPRGGIHDFAVRVMGHDYPGTACHCACRFAPWAGKKGTPKPVTVRLPVEVS